ncbi:ATP-binding protein [Paludibacterium sp. THUN1379]|uniref:ATP-binding protein n=1 Tax=Paludibacterium sp. THUN1379 TaxID=3112107 RepID=UPI0030D587FD
MPGPAPPTILGRLSAAWVILCLLSVAGLLMVGHRHDWLWLQLLIGLTVLIFPAPLQWLSFRLQSWAHFRARLAPFIEAIPNAVVVIDRDGRIAALNARTEAWFGYSQQELIGAPVETLLPPALRGKHVMLRQGFMQAMTSRAMGQGRELFACRRDGSVFPVEIGLNPLATSKGTMVLSSIIDISERRAVEGRFHAQAAEVERASRYKSEFLANMSHELRTPLNSILILSEQLCANPQHNLLPRQINYAEIIHQSGCDLLALIEDILDLSRIEAGKLEVHKEQMLTSELCSYLQRAFAPMAESRQLSLQCEMAPDLPDSIVLDFKRTYQILKNLFSNACKFTPAGGQIHIRLAFAEPWLSFSVADTGCGIPPDKQEEIFQAFVQLDGSASRKFSGTGLGLAIARQLATLLGGDLQVRSEPQLGSTFTLRLPLLPDELADTPLRRLDETKSSADMPLALPPELSGRKVLLVDDEIRNVFAMSSLLEEAGMNVCVARNGQEALDIVRQQPDIELVMMDMMMPVLDGYQATTALRQELSFHKPILALTGLAMKGDREKCLAAGADDYLAKPVQRQALLTLLSKLLQPSAT